MSSSRHADTNTLAESCDNKFEFDVATVSFSPDMSHLPLSNNIDIDKDSTHNAPIQLNIPSPGICEERPLALSEFIDLFYKNQNLGYCPEITYPLIDITNSTRQLLLPALCDTSKLEKLVGEQNGNIWCDITLKSFGRSPWWQTIELSTAMASAIAELNCRHNVFCKKVSNIMRTSVYNMETGELHAKDAIRCTLPDYSDIYNCHEETGTDGNARTGKIPTLADLIHYLDAWCGVLRIARSLGYYPKPPKNLIPLNNVSWEQDWTTKCCNPSNLFKNEVWDLVPELCENIKNIIKLKDKNIDCDKYTFLHYKNGNKDKAAADSKRGFTNKINCCEPDHHSMAINKEGKENEWGCDGHVDDHGVRWANPTGYIHVSGFLKLIQMGLFDWAGCLAGKDTEPDLTDEMSVKDEIMSDAKDWSQWFIENDAGPDCGYDYDSSHIIPSRFAEHAKRRKNNLKIAFLLKLATLKFCSGDSFKDILDVNNFTKEEDGMCYDYTDTLKYYFNPVSNNKNKVLNNCNYYNPCQRMTIKKNILKINKCLKQSLLRLCGCSLTKDELLTTISDYIVRDMNTEGSGLNNIINAKMNINFCKQENGIEHVVMYDSNIKIDLGVYAALASSCKDKQSVDKVIKYIFNNPNNDVLSAVADSLLVELQTMYPSCYPAGFAQTQVSEYGNKIYEEVLAGPGYDANNKFSSPNLNNRLITHNKFMDCFKKPNSFISDVPCEHISVSHGCTDCEDKMEGM